MSALLPQPLTHGSPPAFSPFVPRHWHEQSAALQADPGIAAAAAGVASPEPEPAPEETETPPPPLIPGDAAALAAAVSPEHTDSEGERPQPSESPPASDPSACSSCRRPSAVNCCPYCSAHLCDDEADRCFKKHLKQGHPWCRLLAYEYGHLERLIGESAASDLEELTRYDVLNLPALTVFAAEQAVRAAYKGGATNWGAYYQARVRMVVARARARANATPAYLHADPPLLRNVAPGFSTRLTSDTGAPRTSRHSDRDPDAPPAAAASAADAARAASAVAAPAPAVAAVAAIPAPAAAGEPPAAADAGGGSPVAEAPFCVACHGEPVTADKCPYCDAVVCESRGDRCFLRHLSVTPLCRMLAREYDLFEEKYGARDTNALDIVTAREADEMPRTPIGELEQAVRAAEGARDKPAFYRARVRLVLARLRAHPGWPQRELHAVVGPAGGVRRRQRGDPVEAPRGRHRLANKAAGLGGSSGSGSWHSAAMEGVEYGSPGMAVGGGGLDPGGSGLQLSLESATRAAVQPAFLPPFGPLPSAVLAHELWGPRYRSIVSVPAGHVFPPLPWPQYVLPLATDVPPLTSVPHCILSIRTVDAAPALSRPCDRCGLSCLGASSAPSPFYGCAHGIDLCGHCAEALLQRAAPGPTGAAVSPLPVEALPADGTVFDRFGRETLADAAELTAVLDQQPPSRPSSAEYACRMVSAVMVPGQFSESEAAHRSAGPIPSKYVTISTVRTVWEERLQSPAAAPSSAVSPASRARRASSDSAAPGRLSGAAAPSRPAVFSLLGESELKQQNNSVLSLLHARNWMLRTHSCCCSVCGLAQTPYWFCSDCHLSLCALCWGRCMAPGSGGGNPPMRDYLQQLPRAAPRRRW